MAAEWFVQAEDGAVRGPFSSAEMKQKAGDGIIRPSTLVRRGLQGKWVQARKVKGLVADFAEEEIMEWVRSPNPPTVEMYSEQSDAAVPSLPLPPSVNESSPDAVESLSELPKSQPEAQEATGIPAADNQSSGYILLGASLGAFLVFAVLISLSNQGKVVSYNSPSERTVSSSATGFESEPEKREDDAERIRDAWRAFVQGVSQRIPVAVSAERSKEWVDEFSITIVHDDVEKSNSLIHGVQGTMTIRTSTFRRGYDVGLGARIPSKTFAMEFDLTFGYHDGKWVFAGGTCKKLSGMDAGQTSPVTDLQGWVYLKPLFPEY
jgi:hypothetical protein